MEIKTINLAQKFELFSDYWSPKIVGRLNGQAVKLVKAIGELVKHTHEDEDELFFVLEGIFYLELDNKTVEVKAGEFVIIPAGIPHRPYAPKEVKLMLFEPEQIKHTGDIIDESTIDVCDEI